MPPFELGTEVIWIFFGGATGGAVRSFARPGGREISLHNALVDALIGGSAAIFASDLMAELIPFGSELSRDKIAPLFVGIVGTGGWSLVMRVVELAVKEKTK